MKKILISILMLLLFTSNVSAAECTLEDENGFCLVADKNTRINIEGTNYFGADLEKGVHPGNTYYKITDDNQLLFCSNVLLSTRALTDPLEPIDKKCKVIEKNKYSLIYAYEYGYGSVLESGKYNYNSDYLTGEKLEDYYITQTAIWHFTPNTIEWLDEEWSKSWFQNYDFKNKTYKGITDPTITRASNLVNDAEKASTASPSLSISTTNLNMNLSSDGKYYISDEIKLTGSYLTDNITASITGIEGAFIVEDKKATVGITTLSDATTSQISKTIYVKVPIQNISKETTNVTLHVASKSSFNDKTIIRECYPQKISTTTTLQSMIKYIPNYTTLDDEITLNIKKHSVTITKKDSDGKQLSGATLVIKQNGKEITSWTSNGTKNVMLSPGTYTLEETKAPSGYIPSKEPITFTIDDSGLIYVNNNITKEIVITNKPIIITVSKREYNKEEELEGATLVITDKDGNTVKDMAGNELRWVSENVSKKIHIAAGTYILSEEKSPEGYELSDKSIEFTVDKEGIVTIKQGLIKTDKKLTDNIIIFENTPEPEPVPTGSKILYITIIVGILAFGVSTLIVVKQD